MLYEELKSFRDECSKLTIAEFIEFFKDQNCDESYARENWISFQDGPMLYITWHSSGEDLFYYILSFIAAPRKACAKAANNE